MFDASRILTTGSSAVMVVISALAIYVALEATGDISVLHGDPDAPTLDPTLLRGVRGSELLH